MTDQPSKPIYWTKSSDFEEKFDTQSFVDDYRTFTPGSWLEELMDQLHSIFISGNVYSTIT